MSLDIKNISIKSLQAPEEKGVVIPQSGRPPGAKNKKHYIDVLDNLIEHRFNPVQRLIKTYPKLSPKEKADICLNLIKLAVQQQAPKGSSKTAVNVNLSNITKGGDTPEQREVQGRHTLKELLKIAGVPDGDLKTE